jgi:hypothetical protein
MFDRSPLFEETRAEKVARVNQISNSPSLQLERKTSLVRFAEPPEKRPHLDSCSSSASGGAYPWLHGENGIFPTTSTSASGQSMLQMPQTSSIGISFNGSGADLFGGADGQRGGLGGFMSNKIHRTSAATKKGAQPSADGFFHCRLCDKRFEKVKSLNAHMKSHAMKARAEAEAASQAQNAASGRVQHQSQSHQRNGPFGGNKPDTSALDSLSQVRKGLRNVLY